MADLETFDNPIDFNWMAQADGNVVAAFHKKDGTVELHPQEGDPIMIVPDADLKERICGDNIGVALAFQFRMLANYVGSLRASVVELLKVLPDSSPQHEDDDVDGHEQDSWKWCWNELTNEAQELVKTARTNANKVVEG